jgi:hypothetical protein
VSNTEQVYSKDIYVIYNGLPHTSDYQLISVTASSASFAMAVEGSRGAHTISNFLRRSLRTQNKEHGSSLASIPEPFPMRLTCNWGEKNEKVSCLAADWKTQQEQI